MRIIQIPDAVCFLCTCISYSNTNNFLRREKFSHIVKCAARFPATILYITITTKPSICCTSHTNCKKHENLAIPSGRPLAERPTVRFVTSAISKHYCLPSDNAYASRSRACSVLCPQHNGSGQLPNSRQTSSGGREFQHTTTPILPVRRRARAIGQ